MTLPHSAGMNSHQSTLTLNIDMNANDTENTAQITDNTLQYI